MEYIKKQTTVANTNEHMLLESFVVRTYKIFMLWFPNPTVEIASSKLAEFFFYFILLDKLCIYSFNNFFFTFNNL